MIDAFLKALDAVWVLPSGHPAGHRIELKLIGSTALMLQVGLNRGTKDSDVLEVALSKDVTAALRHFAGKGTRLHQQHRLYIDIVPQGIPFLPHGPNWQQLTALSETLSHFDVAVLDVVDVVVTKLKRFSANDRSDIDEMIAAGVVPHNRLVERFESAVDWFCYDARAPELPRYISHLNTVERDSFGVPETVIELPHWFDA